MRGKTESAKAGMKILLSLGCVREMMVRIRRYSLDENMMTDREEVRERGAGGWVPTIHVY